MTDDRNSYRSITKAIGLFGGTKAFQIIISIIKNKFVAVLLGPVGMGIAGMITSTTGFISALTGFGLHTSAVRDIVQAYSSGDNKRISRVVSILRKLVIFTGLIGTVVTFLFARSLSVWSFGNYDYTFAFRLVSVILFIDQLCIGQTVLLQGTFHYRMMAKSSLLGSVIGLFISVPLYYVFGMKAIVPVIIVSSFTNMMLSWYYSHKIAIPTLKISLKEAFTGGKVMLVLGFAIALKGVINTGSTYLLRLFISNFGNIADVGLYTAGIAIATSYIDVVLSSMGSDYSPRLSSIANDNKLFSDVINRQMILLTAFIAPLIIFFIVFVRQFTILLYSVKFLAIIGMIEWMMVGMFFRAISWCLSYSCIAKGDSKLFFLNELGATIYTLALTVTGYKLYSFSGMGIAFCVTYIMYFIQMFFVCSKRYDFSLSMKFFKMSIPLIGISFIFFFLGKLELSSFYHYLIGIIGILIVTCISYRQLDKLLDLKSIIKAFKTKIKHKNYINK